VESLSRRNLLVERLIKMINQDKPPNKSQREKIHPKFDLVFNKT